MEFMLWMVHVLVAAGVIGLVLLQHGKGADMGAAFGSGSSGSLFGATGSANFLSRSTAVLAAMFFMTSMALAYLSSRPAQPVAAPLAAPAQPVVPVSPALPTPAAPAQQDADKSGAIPK
jgi:preprotein translocase subunit SecG